ncbi:MAG: hypothetical protein V1799_13660 [bacterium]
MKLFLLLFLILLPIGLMAQTSARGIALVSAIVVPAVWVEVSPSEKNPSSKIVANQSCHEITFQGSATIQVEFQDHQSIQQKNLSLKAGISTSVHLPSQKKTQTIRITHLSN